MNRPQAWIVAAVLSAGAAGVAVGSLLCQEAAAAGNDLDLSSADRQLVEQYTDEFKLSGEQVRLMRAILHQLRADETAIYRRSSPNLPADVQDGLGRARRAAQSRIEFMLDARQRVRYEQGKQPDPTNQVKR